MQLVIQNGKIIATHEESQNISASYPGCEIIIGNALSPVEHIGEDSVQRHDPRTAKEKADYYLDSRRLEYPSVQDQLDMMYWDAVNKTKTWVDTISAIKSKYPKVGG